MIQRQVSVRSFPAAASVLLIATAWCRGAPPVGEGGGVASVVDTVQVKYSDSTDGNVVIIEWNRNAPGTAQAQILVDGTPAATVTANPGPNTASLRNVDTGSH